MTDEEFSIDEARELATSIRSLVHWAGRAAGNPNTPLVARLQGHLAVDEALPNSSVSFDPIERANLQLAFDAIGERADVWEIFGVPPEIAHYGGVSLASIAAGTFQGPKLSGAPQYVAVPSGPGETMRCLRGGVIVIELDESRLAALIVQSDRGRGPSLDLEVLGDDQVAVDAFLDEVRREMAAHNVIRGQAVSFTFNEFGGFGLDFVTVPSVARHEVILPERDLAAIERHASGVTDASETLVDAGQHLRRGLLLYGPPGTGKTHTVSYLVGSMPDRTTVILSGASVQAIGQAGALARSLAPATIVVEDVDLIGMDRGLPGGEHNPLLFQLLNEMDGLADDLDVLFVLTTNRVDMLEPALAARPGRVDQAIEIGLPDAIGRRALFELYLPEPVESTVLDRVVARTDGAAAAFVRELARRAVLDRSLSARDLGDCLTVVVDGMMETASPLLRSSLAAPAD